MLELEFKQTLKAIEAAETFGFYDERQRHIFLAMNLASHLGYQNGIRPTGLKEGDRNYAMIIPHWAGDSVAYIELPTGEISYFLNKPTRAYDGYTRDTKLERIKDYINDAYPIEGGETDHD